MTITRLTFPTALVLYAIARGHVYGFDIIDVTGLRSGTVYPLLRRLEEGGLLRGTAERTREAQQAGRPARRYYSTTRAGTDALRAALERHPAVRAVIDDAGRTARPRLA